MKSCNYIFIGVLLLSLAACNQDSSNEKSEKVSNVKAPNGHESKEASVEEEQATKNHIDPDAVTHDNFDASFNMQHFDAVDFNLIKSNNQHVKFVIKIRYSPQMSDYLNEHQAQYYVRINYPNQLTKQLGKMSTPLILVNPPHENLLTDKLEIPDTLPKSFDMNLLQPATEDYQMEVLNMKKETVYIFGNVQTMHEEIYH